MREMDNKQTCEQQNDIVQTGMLVNEQHHRESRIRSQNMRILTASTSCLKMVRCKKHSLIASMTCAKERKRISHYTNT